MFIRARSWIRIAARHGFPPLDEDDIQAVVETLRSGWLTLGPRVGAFETACAERLAVPHALFQRWQTPPGEGRAPASPWHEGEEEA